MKEVIIKAYTVNELSAKAKEKVLEEYHYINTYHDWWEPIHEGFWEDLETNYGITGEAWFSGFWSQGDGACFVSETVDTDLLIRKLYEEGYDIPEDCVTHSKNIHVSIQKVKAYFANRYDHENTVECVIHHELDVDDKDLPMLKDVLKAEVIITDWVREKCQELYNLLEKYYVELSAEESIINELNEREYLFTENGTIIPR